MPRLLPVLAAVVLSGGLHPRLASTAHAADDVSIVPGKTDIEFKVGSAVVAKYHVAPTAAKPYLWPVLAPNGAAVTRAWPMAKGTPGETTDHVHQKSAWFCHGDVIPEGLDLKVKSSDKRVHGVDFWAESAGHGKIVCVKVGEPARHGTGHASVTTWNEWRAPDGTKVLDEERTIHLVDRPEGRLFVFDITLMASACPVTFGDTKEGSFGVRVNDAIRTAVATGGAVTAAGGQPVKAPAKDNLPVWGQQADWNDYSGTVDGKPAGVAVFDHPGNAHRAAWHTRGYGLMAANPFGRAGSGFPSQKGKTELVKMPKGGTLRLKYGVYAHTGDAAAGKVAEAFDAFKAMK